MTTYPAITLWQPWATLVAEGFKVYEFRKWDPPHAFINRQIAIHAGMRPIKLAEIRELIYKLERGGDLARATGIGNWPACLKLLEQVLAAPKSLPFGFILCLARLGRPLRNEVLASRLQIAGPLNDSDRDEHSNWGWPLTEIERLEPPVPIKGGQGFWDWDWKR